MYKNILILPDGTELRSGAGEKHAIRSVKLTEMVNSGADIFPGSCCSDFIEASVLDPAGDLAVTAGDEIQLWKEGENAARIKMGVYTVEAPTRPSAGILKLTGYDHAAKLDKDLTAWVAALTEWPYSIQDFATMVCSACGLSFVPAQGFPNENFQVTQWRKRGVTGRQIMRWLGEIACRFVHADPDGNIRFGWYEESGKQLSPGGSNYYFAGSFSYENYQVAPVEIVQLRLSESQAGAVWPASQNKENAYLITGNPILTADVSDELLPVLDAIREALSVAYTPCKVSAVADPTIRAGSIITVQDKEGRQIRGYVMEKTSSGQRDTFVCTGNPRRDTASAVNNQPESMKQAENEANVLAGLTSRDVFNRLTDYGKIQGLSVQDGKWYINAEVAQIVNLVAERLLSALGKSSLHISGAAMHMLYDGKETFYINNEFGNAAQLGFTVMDEAGTISAAGRYNANLVEIGGPEVADKLQLGVNTRDMTPYMVLPNAPTWLMKLAWKDNGDGTYSLIGRK